MESKPRIKVMHVVTRMNVGGVAVLLDNLLTNIDPEQFEVLLVTGMCEAPEFNYLADRDPNYPVRQIQTFHKSSKLKDDFLAFFELRKIIREFSPDVIHTHTSKAGVFGRLASIIFSPSAKRIHTFHGHLLVGYFNKYKVAIVVGVERVLAKFSTLLIAMGTQVKIDLISAGVATESKFRVFYPGLKPLHLVEKLSAQKNLGLDSNVIYCLYIGRLTAIKRPERLLEIAQNLNTSKLALEFLVVGDGELLANMKAEALEHQLPIRFFGWRSDVENFLAASDMLILCSDNEAVALTLIEGAQAGLPLVTTDAGSVRDIAINDENAFVTGFNSQELTEAVVKLAESQSLRDDMGKNGKLLADQLFSISKMTASHEELYMEILRF